MKFSTSIQTLTVIFNKPVGDVVCLLLTTGEQCVKIPAYSDKNCRRSILKTRTDPQTDTLTDNKGRYS